MKLTDEINQSDLAKIIKQGPSNVPLIGASKPVLEPAPVIDVDEAGTRIVITLSAENALPMDALMGVPARLGVAALLATLQCAIVDELALRDRRPAAAPVPKAGA